LDLGPVERLGLLPTPEEPTTAKPSPHAATPTRARIIDTGTQCELESWNALETLRWGNGVELPPFPVWDAPDDIKKYTFYSKNVLSPLAMGKFSFGNRGGPGRGNPSIGICVHPTDFVDPFLELQTPSFFLYNRALKFDEEVGDFDDDPFDMGGCPLPSDPFADF
jgi:hypothetical protein